MRRTLLAATALCTTIMFLIPGQAAAQSLDWSGPYVGANIGLVHSDSPIDFDLLAPVPLEANGGSFGVTAGYNWDLGASVVGVEGDVAIVDAQGQLTEGDDEYETGLDALLTLRGRLGVKAGNALFYGTAGLAAAQIVFSSALDGYAPATGSGMGVGTVIGAGVEYALADNLSIKTEALAFNVSGVEGVGDYGKGTQYEAEYSPSGVSVRSGLNFHF